AGPPRPWPQFGDASPSSWSDGSYRLRAHACGDRVRQRVAVRTGGGVTRDGDRQILDTARVGGEVPLAGTGIYRRVLDRDRGRAHRQRAGNGHWMGAARRWITRIGRRRGRRKREPG